jgi:hypothetical protein
MTVQINIVAGEYRNTPVVNQVFPLIQGYKEGAKGGFVTVDGSAVFGAGREKIRVKVSGIDAYHVVGESATQAKVAAPEKKETDEEAIVRIAERFSILQEMSAAVAAGDIRAMIVTGPPGIGKSFSVEAEVDKAAMLDKIAGRKARSEVVKGTATALGLYAKLYEYRERGSMLVFDDSDSLFFDSVSLNLLKGALDSGKKRKICWLADSHSLRKEDIPNSFQFDGGIIFITNLNFSKIKTKSIKDHLTALESRCHYVDLAINTAKEKILRIKQVISDPIFAEEQGLSQSEQDMLVDFLLEHHTKFRELSIRTVIKLIGLYKTFPAKWSSVASSTMMSDCHS